MADPSSLTYLVSVPRPHSYIVCGTPRTGSTLLCSLLTSTGVAGRPESYFREPDQRDWAARFGVPVDADGRFDYARFVAGALRSGTTANGVFGARIMWGTMHVFVDGLDPHHQRRRGDIEVLENALGPLCFVHVQRRDIVGQAVSWARAEQSGYWQHGDRAPREVRFDLDEIDSLIATIHEHNESWRTWFGAQAVAPFEVTYESLVSEAREAVGGILECIGVKPPSDWAPASTHERQADAINADWVRRYRAARG